MRQLRRIIIHGSSLRAFPIDNCPTNPTQRLTPLITISQWSLHTIARKNFPHCQRDPPLCHLARYCRVYSFRPFTRLSLCTRGVTLAIVLVRLFFFFCAKLRVPTTKDKKKKSWYAEEVEFSRRQRKYCRSERSECVSLGSPGDFEVVRCRFSCSFMSCCSRIFRKYEIGCIVLERICAIAMIDVYFFWYVWSKQFTANSIVNIVKNSKKLLQCFSFRQTVYTYEQYFESKLKRDSRW